MIPDDDSHPLHATALASFVGASTRELSFQRGAELLLYRRLNEHWWEGQAATESDGPRYLVPHLYVKLLVEGAALPSIPARDPTTTASATTDESTSGVDDDAPPVSTSTPTTAPAASSPPKKPPRHSVDDESISPPGVVTPTPTLGRFSCLFISTANYELLRAISLSNMSTVNCCSHFRIVAFVNLLTLLPFLYLLVS